MFKNEKIINLGVSLFSDALKQQGAEVTNAKFTPQAGGDVEMMSVLDSLEKMKPEIDAVGNPDERGYEWITSEDGKNWYRTQGSKDDWVEFSN